MTMKLQCYFHGTIFHSTPAHQKRTPAWGAIVSSGYALFLGMPRPYCRLKVCAALTLHQERFPRVARSWAPDWIFTEGNLREVLGSRLRGAQGWICANSVLFHTRFLHNIFTGKYIHVRVVPKDGGRLNPMNDHAAAVLFFPLWLIAGGASWHKMKKVFFRQYLLPMDICDVCHGCQACGGSPVCFALGAQACWGLQGDEKAEFIWASQHAGQSL